MNFAKRFTLVIAALAVLVAIAVVTSLPNPMRDRMPSIVPEAQAAVTNYSVAAGQVVYIPLHLSGAYSATTTVAKFNMPMPCDLVGVGVAPRLVTTGPSTLDVQLGGVSVLSSTISLSAATYSEGTISTSAITDEGVITVILGVAAGSVTDTTVLLTCVRK